jgi:choline-sulfatase
MDLTRRDFAAGVAAPLFAGALSARPNIVFISSDQHSGRLLGSLHPIVKTPNLDRLARMGVTFRNAYCGNPVCAPGRACMMTGRFASDVGSYCNSTPLGAVPTWGNHLREAGYECWASGKMDLTLGADYGFEQIQTTHGHSRNPDITSLFRAPVCFRPGERKNVDGRFVDRGPDSDGELARRAVEAIRSRKRSPWCVYVGMHMPHPKWVAQKKYEALYPPASMPLPEMPPGYLEQRHPAFQVLANFKNVQTPIPPERMRRARAAYFGMVSEVDEYVGWLLDELERSGELARTLFLYTSDHGEMMGDHGLWLKNVLLENAARVPLLMAGPGLPRGVAIDTPVSHVDMVATILEAGGAARPKNLRGHSLLPLAGGAAGSHPGYAYSESHSEGNCTGSAMVRKGDWKYIHFAGDAPLLFNLRDDPGEFTNLAGAKKTRDVQAELHAILTSLVDPDEVSARAFAEQERRLNAMVAAMKPDEFYEELVGRLGPAQANALTQRAYRRKLPAWRYRPA